MSTEFVKDVNDTYISVQRKTEEYNYDKSCTEYDRDSYKLEYTGARRCCEAICSYVKENRSSISILDVGAGTGILGEERGFRVIDALDVSQGMLNEAKKKGVYRKIFCNFFSSEPLDFLSSDFYDVVTSSACLIPGHLPYDVIIEMIRITKPGGVVCLSCHKEYVNEAPEYAEFFPLCDQLETDGKWKKEYMKVYNGFMRNVDGLILIYRVL